LVKFAIFTLGKYLLVEIDQFRNALKNYPSSTLEEAEKLHALSEAFPYSQLLHVLSARASKDHGLESQQNQLQLAAVYSADRGILKHMMNEDGGRALEITGTTSPAVVESKNAVQQSSDSPDIGDNPALSTAESNVNSDDLAEKVIKDVNELYRTRHNFEMMFVDKAGAQLVESPASSGEEPAKSKRERIIELSKALNAPPMTEGEEQKLPRKRRLERKDIIDEIVLSKNKIEPANEKQKEQLEIIDQFIKTQPSISAAKEKPPHVPDGDLSTIKTGEFGDNIVSETLVELLLKQGKKDKAIEVLKKLIWKFPQKKSYFAAQIDELKK
jgi:hypothetical protein